MPYLTEAAIKARLDADGESRLGVDPLLDDAQVGATGIDLRLGYDFLVSVLTRKPYINVDRSRENFRRISSYFQTTRREVGDRFMLYPGQVVLGTTLEFIAMPTDLYGELYTRSSYTRLGIHLATLLQPGFRGCASLELANHGNSPIELMVGSRIVQMRFSPVSENAEYVDPERKRKYLANVRPVVPTPDRDADLELLARMRDKR